MNSEVDDFIDRASKWQAETTELRNLLLECGLAEEIKWRQPCYSLNMANVAIIGAFKDYITLSFFKGVLLKDDERMLHQPGANSRSVRMFKFTAVDQIHEIADTIKAYVFEAVEIEKAGLKVDVKAINELGLPEELIERFDQFPELKIAFEALTPGRQRGYLIFFTGAKQSKTRLSRIDQYSKRILNGKGFHDCVCGHSKRMPNCDGSHKFYE
jgi:uncharacterized protein YdeI (YjbR/CyaY-like superfamily)